MMDLDNSTLPSWVRTLLREPLVHFLFFGVLIFGADAALTTMRGSERDIIVPAHLREEIRSTFAASKQRDPSPAEMKQLTARWVDNEILYREGLSLGLDKGDPAMRERVIFKALSVVQAGLVMPRVDDAGLRVWFEANRARYDVPARFTFDEAVPSADATPESLRKFVAALNGDIAPEIESSLRVFKQRPRQSVAQAYGEDFAKALERARPGEWTAVASTSGLRAIRVGEVTAGRLLAYEDVRDSVYQDWRDDTAARLTSQAVRDLGRRYVVRGGDGS